MRRALLALLVLPLALAACTGTEARVARQLAPKASVQQAAQKTVDATSEHITLSAGVLRGSVTGRVTGSGDFDNANRRGSFHLELPRLGEVDAVVDGTSAYLKAPFLAAFLPAGKTWLELNGKASGFGVVPQNPEQALARLKKLASVREVGDETIGGVNMTHYHGTGRLGSGNFDVWIGKDDGYVHRIAAAVRSRTGSGNGVLSFSDFGEPVSVDVPPASDTADGTNLVPFLRRG